MGFDIPEPYVWDESFKVFYENLDEEHKAIFKCIFECAGKRDDKAALDNLVSVTKNHFSDEEGMMAKSSTYKELSAHKKLHEDFVAKISGLSCPLGDDTIKFAKEWLVNHIKGTDFAYKGML